MARWELTIRFPFFHDDDLDFGVKRDRIVDKIKNSGWRDITPYPDTFDDLVADLSNSTGTSEFDAWWDELYDLADDDRVWLETH